MIFLTISASFMCPEPLSGIRLQRHLPNFYLPGQITKASSVQQKPLFFKASDTLDSKYSISYYGVIKKHGFYEKMCFLHVIYKGMGILLSMCLILWLTEDLLHAKSPDDSSLSGPILAL